MVGFPKYGHIYTCDKDAPDCKYLVNMQFV